MTSPRTRLHWREALTILLGLAFLIGAAAVPGRPAENPSIETALDGAVRILITLRWPGQSTPSDVQGSGWTRSCTPARQGGYDVVVATAGHVVDVAGIVVETHLVGIPSVEVVVAYRDGQRFTADPETLRLDRVTDYGEIRIHTQAPRRVLPVGPGGAPLPGAALVAVASPGPLAFGVFSGHLILLAPIPVNGAPKSAWLASIAVAPGASGAPVFDSHGRVVATVIGLVEWAWGGRSAVIVPLPQALAESGGRS